MLFWWVAYIYYLLSTDSRHPIKTQFVNVAAIGGPHSFTNDAFSRSVLCSDKNGDLNAVIGSSHWHSGF